MNNMHSVYHSQDELDFLARFEFYKPEMERLYTSLYHERGWDSFVSMLQKRWSDRPSHMRVLDVQRMADRYWYMNPRMLGTMLYVDNFAGTFQGVIEKLPYLVETGITYLHLMPVFKMPAQHNDGGYAVSDFTVMDPRFGTDAEFDALASECHMNGISICLDFVLNHTSDEHIWAIGAKSGDQSCKDRYFIFPDRVLPDMYEETVGEVFPVIAPGNFTYDYNMQAWVLTTFNHFQWDLNYSNPTVLNDMVDAMLAMANRGVDIFRFDAIPYIWKTWGTNCRNLPEVHTLVRLFRLALEVAAPCTIIKGEVVMAPREVAPYFGTAKAPECHLLYNVSLMVQLWNSLATRDVRMLASMLKSIPDNLPQGAAWVNYVRCHDDIGWGLDEHVVSSLGFDPFLHKRFLISFYLGTYPGSFSSGELYESDPKTLDARNCGTCASLCGLERALENHDEYQQELAVKRIILLHALSMVTNGIPVIYSGDELAQLNDHGYTHYPSKVRDSRFLHRGLFDWALAGKRYDLSNPHSLVYTQLHRLTLLRKQEAIPGSASRLRVLESNDISIVKFFVEPRIGTETQNSLFVVANFSEHQKQVFLETPVALYGQVEAYNAWRDVVQGKILHPSIPTILGPYEFLLLEGVLFHG